MILKIAEYIKKSNLGFEPKIPPYGKIKENQAIIFSAGKNFINLIHGGESSNINEETFIIQFYIKEDDNTRINQAKIIDDFFQNTKAFLKQNNNIISYEYTPGE